MPDLSTTYLGLSLSNPIVPSSSPLTRRLDALKKMEDAGAAAIVLYSLFEEQALLESKMLDLYLSEGTESFAEALTYLPEAPDYRSGPDDYMEHIFKAKNALTIPVIASLNGYSPGGWVRYAKEMEQAGADALELNTYFVATDPSMSGRAVEDMYVELLSEVKGNVKIPVAVKLSPFFSALPNMALRLSKAGARGLALFNRFYQPDIDIELLDVVPHLVLSHSDELRLPLRWIAVLYGKTDADLALTTGVHTAEDVIKGLLVGASVTMMASELLQNGVGRISAILRELHVWLEEHEYDSVAQLEGSMSLQSVANPAGFERANYMRVLGSYAPARP
jgi:dihydroorotate dehydrogenase (fumarate)